jgi:hypothetical protein
MTAKRQRGGARVGAGRKPTLRDPVTLSVRIEATDSDALVQLAEAAGVSFSDYVRRVLMAHVRNEAPLTGPTGPAQTKE